MSARSRLGASALALAAGLAGCIPDERQEPPRAEVVTAEPARPGFVIANRARFAIAELRTSALAEQTWEASLLDAPLLPGARAAAERLPCGRYDLLIVREDGARCVLANTTLCFQEGEPWMIHDVTFESCRWQP